MPRFQALYTDYPWANPSVEQSILDEVDCRIIDSPDNRVETLERLAPGVDVIITCWAPVTKQVIDAADKCRYIARTGIGLDNIDVEHATSKGILVTNVPDYCIQEVAEHTLALIFALGRNVADYHLATKEGEYDLRAGLPVERIGGKTLGVIGLGRIGRRLAELAAALGMNVLGTNRSQQALDGVAWRPLDELLAESDYVSLQVPLTEETANLINDRTLSLMKPSAYVVNTSRGGLVDHDALSRALSANKIAGAALDVQSPEPPDLASAPYCDPRVIVTPHAAFCSSDSTLELRTRVSRQVATFLAGARPDNVVNPTVLR